jgi:hypothetical protein
MNKKVKDNLDNLEDEEKCSLAFYNFVNAGYPKLKIKKRVDEGLSTEELIILVLAYKDVYASINTITKVIETDVSKHRSSLDIWRHCIHFNPKITLVEVMAILYKLCIGTNGILRTQFCSIIQKRVFDLKTSYLKYMKLKEPGILNFNYYTNSGHAIRMDLKVCLFDRDEYDLIFSQWKDIDKEKKEQ